MVQLRAKLVFLQFNVSIFKIFKIIKSLRNGSET